MSDDICTQDVQLSVAIRDLTRAVQSLEEQVAAIRNSRLESISRFV